MDEIFVHPSSVVDDGAVIGSGCRIWHFSHVMSGAVLGRSCNIGQNVMIASGVKLGSNVKVQNNVSERLFGGNVQRTMFFGGLRACFLM